MREDPRLISIIVPIHNQADHIQAIIQDNKKALENLSQGHELLLIVNGCTDDSLEICERLAQNDSAARVIEIEEGSWGMAVRRGISESTGDLICYLNSARTSPEELTLALLYATVHGDVVVKANRRIRESWTRRLGSLLYNLECRSLFDLAYWDINGTPKVFPRRFDRLLRLTRDDDLIDLEFNIVCRCNRYPMLEIPLFSTHRHGGKSTTTWKSALRMYWGAYRLWRNPETHE